MTSPLAELSARPALLAIGWALVHSLWQLALVAAATAAAWRGLAGRPARERYVLSCAALALMLALPIGTALVVYRPDAAMASTAPPAGASVALAPGLPSRGSAGAALIDGLVAWNSDGGDTEEAHVSNLAARVETWLPLLVVVWLAGVSLLAARAGGGWWLVRRRVSDALAAPEDSALVARVRLLARRLGVRRAVRAVRSSLVEVPSVAGWLKPVLLVPASALSGLSVSQVDAILAHELAHVRRHDYLVNLAQTAAETLLFYHPATWWVSSRIRAAREHCCDDLAVAVSGDVVGYADALARLERLRAARPATLVAADGGRLIDRVRRLAGHAG